MSRKEGILEEIDNFIKENNKQLFVLMIVDIINMDTTLLVNGTLSKVVESAFDVTLKENLALIEGKVSRKHDIYPPIASELEKLKEGDYVEEDENNTDEVDETNTITIITPNSNKFLNFQIKNYFILFLSLLFI